MEHHTCLWENTAVSPAMARAIGGWRRLFYGKATPRGGHPTALAALLTGYLAELVTGELELSVTGGSRGDYLEGQMATLRAALPRAVQLAAAQGQCILRPRLNGDQILVETISASEFYPTRLKPDGSAAAGFFTDFRKVGKEQLVRLESFDFADGTLEIKNRAYRMRGDGLGQEIPLDSVEEWRNLEKDLTINQAPGPLFGVIRMPFANTIDPGSMLPVSLLAGAEQSIGEFERLWGELLYELHSGKRKRIIERQALPGLGENIPGTLGYQDLATDTYLVLDPMEQSRPFDDYSPVIRTEEYLTGLQSLLRLIESQCHLSPGGLSLEKLTAGVPVTAAEVMSRDTATYHTCTAVEEQGMRQGILDTIRAMDVLCDLYGLCPSGEYRVSLTFGDGIFEDTQQEFSRRLQMVEKGILRPERLLGWYFHADEEEILSRYLRAAQ